LLLLRDTSIEGYHSACNAALQLDPTITVPNTFEREALNEDSFFTVRSPFPLGRKMVSFSTPSLDDEDKRIERDDRDERTGDKITTGRESFRGDGRITIHLKLPFELNSNDPDLPHLTLEICDNRRVVGTRRILVARDINNVMGVTA